MHRWTIGEVEITRVEDLNFAVPSDVPVPDCVYLRSLPRPATSASCSARSPSASDGIKIVVDPWLANDGPRDEPDAAKHADRLLRELADVGFPPDEVDVVVNSHLDGVGWNTSRDAGWEPAFPNARYLYPATELAAIAGVSRSTASKRWPTWQRARPRTRRATAGPHVDGVADGRTRSQLRSRCRAHRSRR